MTGTPLAHHRHDADTPCGCWVAGKKYFTCTCGAAYGEEAMSFPRWRCYDCGKIWVSELEAETKQQSDIHHGDTDG